MADRFGYEAPARLSDDEIVRLTALGLTTIEVAHDLNNLLQVIGSAIRLIEDGLDPAADAELRRFVDGALAAIDRATLLSRRVLDLAKPRREPEEFVHLDAVLAEIRDLIALAAGPSVAVEFACGADVPAIACHRRDLENVILNLVVNARDAMRGTGRLTLSLEQERLAEASRGRSGLVLRIADTGCGMPREVAMQAFRPFFTTKPEGHGTGLGLALAGSFARRSGGSVEIESVVGAGTTIVLRLPGSGG